MRWVQNDLSDFTKLANSTAKEYRDSKVVGKTTRQYVEVMASTADKFKEAINDWQMVEYQGALNRRMNSVEIAGASIVEKMKGMPGELLKVLTKIKGLKDERDKLSVFHKFYQEWPRTLSGDLGNYVSATKNPTLSKCVASWVKLGRGSPNNSEELREYVAALMDAMEKLKKALISEGIRV
jgi:hypothetical protein